MEAFQQMMRAAVIDVISPLRAEFCELKNFVHSGRPSAAVLPTISSPALPVLFSSVAPATTTTTSIPHTCAQNIPIAHAMP
jgi:predicted AlkP superfamily phosphohydrolase/phosphomutase